MPANFRLTFQPFNTTPPTAVEVTSVSFEAEQTLNIGSQSTGAGAGKVTFNPFSFTKHPDSFSPQLFTMLCSGTPFRKVTFEATASGNATPYFTFTMGLAAVKTIAFSSPDPEGRILEVITLLCGQVAYSVTQQNADGSFGKPVATAWDRVKNISEDPTKVGAA